VNDYFEIVRRSRKRFEWVFVSVRDGRHRVVARSGRDYRSRKKVLRAIRGLQHDFRHAEIRDNNPFRFPRTKFEIVPGVLPLRVQTPTGFVPTGHGGHTFAAITPAKAQEHQTSLGPSDEQPAQVSSGRETAAETAESQAEQEQKSVSGGRRRRAT
jgi:hypothetical protein